MALLPNHVLQHFVRPQHALGETNHVEHHMNERKRALWGELNCDALQQHRRSTVAHAHFKRALGLRRCTARHRRCREREENPRSRLPHGPAHVPLRTERLLQREAHTPIIAPPATGDVLNLRV